jgi:hypothetical protein
MDHDSPPLKNGMDDFEPGEFSEGSGVNLK